MAEQVFITKPVSITLNKTTKGYTYEIKIRADTVEDALTGVKTSEEGLREHIKQTENSNANPST